MRFIKILLALILILSPSLTWISITNSSCINRFIEKDLVYILPYEICRDYWYKTYGDRIYYYVYENLSDDQNYINRDFNYISSFYDKIIVVIPADDTLQFLLNLKIIDSLAGRNNLKVIYAIFPKEKYGREDTYLDNNSEMHGLVLQNLEFLNNLSNTSKIAVWYGWSYRCNPKDIVDFYYSLPSEIREKYAIWLDEEYTTRLTKLYEEGLPKDTLVITEAYSRNLIDEISDRYVNQLLITGYEDATSVDDWRTHIEELLSICKTNRVGIWIYYDKNDGSGENYTAYINNRLTGFCKNLQKGFSYAAWWNDTLLQNTSDDSLENLRNTGTEWVSLIPTWYQDTVHSTDIRMDENRTPSDESIIHVIEKIHDLGMHVMLKPHIDPSNDEWRGFIEFNSEDEWHIWFNSYKNFISHYLKIANEYNVEQFCIGCELVKTTNRREWYDIIKMVRENFSGNITYAADWSNYMNIPFWDKLDFIGIDGYFQLTNKTEPSLEELLKGWSKWKRDIEKLYNTTGKPIIFTEIGYRSIDGCNIDPWNWQRRGRVDLQEQRDCYQAVFETFWREEWFNGIYWWMWYPDSTVGGAMDTSYTPYGKPAERILKDYYSNFSINIVKPRIGYLYLFGEEMAAIPSKTIIIGSITVEVEISKEVDKIEFYIDDELKYIDEQEPYQWMWNENIIGTHELKVIAYDSMGDNSEDKQSLWIINL
ncbi:MAG: hypothetical protein DRN12_03590 [Thermoplasmata archaeon]|nr:MAG: hypothetical protein DRN12_03590 [Thermoplasmata archaeon]